MPRSRGPRRQTTWFDSSWNFDIAVGGNATDELTPVGENLEGFTAARLILSFTLLPSVPSGATGEMLVTYGIAMVSQDAFDAGAASLPDPISSTSFPVDGWLIRENRVVVDRTASEEIRPTYVTYDLRAQRKLENSLMAFIWKVTTIRGSTFNLRTLGWSRLLCLRP